MSHLSSVASLRLPQFRLVKFEAWHATALAVQPAQQGDAAAIAPEDLREVESEQSMTAFDEAGPFACAGLIAVPGWHGQRMLAWALLGRRLGAARLLFITRAILRALEACPARRIEMTVDSGFPAGILWAARLGFTAEGRMRGYGPDGRDHYLFARISSAAALPRADADRVGVAAGSVGAKEKTAANKEAGAEEVQQ